MTVEHKVKNKKCSGAGGVHEQVEVAADLKGFQLKLGYKKENYEFLVFELFKVDICERRPHPVWGPPLREGTPS